MSEESWRAEKTALVPKEEIDSRIGSIQKTLGDRGIDGALILHNPNLFYFAGSVQDAFLWIPAAGEPTLFVRKHADKARGDSPLGRIVPIKSPKQLPSAFQEAGIPRDPCFGMEFDVLPVTMWRFFCDLFPKAEIVDISEPVWKVRTIKSPFEIEMIRTAGKIVVSTLEEVPSFFQAGMTELELSALLVQRMRLKGHHGFIRTRGWRSEIFVGGTVSSGASSGAPWPFDGPVGLVSQYPGMNTLNSRRPIGKDEPLLIDMLGGYNGYHYDYTRTFVRGTLDPRLRRAHETAVRIRDRIIERMKPGVLPQALYEQALALADEAGFRDAFMNHGANQVRFIGHGIGLELDEAPVLARGFDTPLAEGNVVALEPKFIFPGAGGAGVEDTVLVTSKGGQILFPSPAGIRSIPG